MHYHLVATPAFAKHWFPKGPTPASLSQAPTIAFNRKDKLPTKAINTLLGKTVTPKHCHYVPSSEQFVTVIRSGLAYGLLPQQQCQALLAAGELIDLASGFTMPVSLYWHYWQHPSSLAIRFFEALEP